MRAILYRRPGLAEDVLELAELPTPDLAPGEVLVRVSVSGVNPSDVKLRAGGRPGVEGLPYPAIIPHSDGAGVIEAVGEGVAPARIGQSVWLWNAQWQRANGSCAEYIALPENQAVPLPDGIDVETGACLGIPAVTAHACLYADSHPLGETVLITGGAGAVSAYAIRMASLAGAKVISTVSSQEKADIALEAGAQAVINYRDEDIAARIMDLTDGYGIDRAIDLEIGSNIAAIAETIREQGIIVGYGSAALREPALPFYPLMFKRVTLRTELVYILPDAPRLRATADITRMLEEGVLAHRIARRFPIGQTAQAHAFVETGNKIGTVLVDLT